MRLHRTPSVAAAAALALLAAGLATTASAVEEAGGTGAGSSVCSDSPGHPPSDAEDPGAVVVTPLAMARDWDPVTDAKWAFADGEVVLTERGTAQPGPRRPFEYAVVTRGPELTSLSYEASVRIDEPVDVSNRDVILVWNYQSPTRFYYAHLSQDNTIYPHNGIFVVDDADRLRIDDQWDVSTGAPPAIVDTDWHDVRLDFCAATGRIEVYVDGAGEPLMTATDTTFAGGRFGFGSFDNYGRLRDARVVGAPVLP